MSEDGPCQKPGSRIRGSHFDPQLQQIRLERGKRALQRAAELFDHALGGDERCLACLRVGEQLTELHHQFIHDLEAKGMLVGAGPFLDDTGNRFGTGMIIFRAATRAEAETIANKEPYIAHGTRRLKLVPWQRIAGH